MKLFLTLNIVFCVFFAKAQDTLFFAPYHSGNINFSVEDKIGLLSQNKKVIIHVNYDGVSDVRYNLIKVRLGDKIGFVDTRNNLKIPFSYEEDNINIIGARISKSLSFDNNGNVALTTFLVGVDNEYSNFSEGVCAVVLHGKYGFIDTSGKQVIPFIFDGADNFYNEIAIVKINDKYGAINHLGNFVIPCKYDLLVIYEDRRLYARLNGEDILLDYIGKEIPNGIDD